MTIEQIAHLCYTINRLFCESHNDYSRKLWNKLSQKDKDSMIRVVQFIKDNPIKSFRKNKIRVDIFRIICTFILFDDEEFYAKYQKANYEVDTEIFSKEELKNIKESLKEQGILV